MQPCTSASFSAASVGPKSAYRSRTSDNARSRYASGRRLLLGRPRRFETRLAAPPSFKPASNRKTARRFRPRSSRASTTRRRPDRTPSRTSSRSNSFLLIDTTAIAHPRGPSNPGQCHVNFAEGGHLYIAATVLMAKTHPPYAPEFRRQMVELVRAGRDPADLAREFEPSSQAIRNWGAPAHPPAGPREVKPAAVAGLSVAEREELTRLRRENKQLRLERDILSRATAWFARETGVIPSGSSGS